MALDFLKGLVRGLGHDETPSPERAEDREHRDAAAALVKRIVKAVSPQRIGDDLRESAAYRELLESPPQVRKSALFHAVDRLLALDQATGLRGIFQSTDYGLRRSLRMLVTHLVRGKLLLRHEEVIWLVRACSPKKVLVSGFAHRLGAWRCRALRRIGRRAVERSPARVGDASREIELPLWRIRAEFFVEGNLEETSPAGIFLFVSTDQVRFYAADERIQPMRLCEVPPLVFSEVMRDVDLFVGVASVGNDPNWADGGPEERYRDYWQHYSFGDLSETAKTRREVLERLLPRLKIAQRCSLADKFLVVRGELRTYKIHLGSGNILMSPNDQYLCIVPGPAKDSAKGSPVFLPFEGDRTLSIILSKAFMLAEDTKIKDPSITRQIGRRGD